MVGTTPMNPKTPPSGEAMNSSYLIRAAMVKRDP
jgi:hypothetical protein